MSILPPTVLPCLPLPLSNTRTQKRGTTALKKAKGSFGKAYLYHIRLGFLPRSVWNKQTRIRSPSPNPTLAPVQNFVTPPPPPPPSNRLEQLQTDAVEGLSPPPPPVKLPETPYPANLQKPSPPLCRFMLTSVWNEQTRIRSPALINPLQRSPPGRRHLHILHTLDRPGCRGGARRRLQVYHTRSTVMAIVFFTSLLAACLMRQLVGPNIQATAGCHSTSAPHCEFRKSVNVSKCHKICNTLIPMWHVEGIAKCARDLGSSCSVLLLQILQGLQNLGLAGVGIPLPGCLFPKRGSCSHPKGPSLHQIHATTPSAPGSSGGETMRMWN